jgi:type IV pilus assembly protein PilB
MDIKDLLIKNNYITTEEYEKLEDKAKQISSSIEELVIGRSIITEDQLGELVTKEYSIPHISLIHKTIDADIVKILPEKIAIEKKIIAFDRTESTLKIGMTNPRDINTIEFVKKGTGYMVDPYFITELSFFEGLKMYKTSIKEELKNIIEKNEKATKGLKGNDADALPIINITDTILEYAKTMGASDIHIEPLEERAIIRYRIDGILHDQAMYSLDIHKAVVARIKILSNLKIDEHRLPQDGRFKTTLNDQDISFRVSTMPVYFGEVIVARLLEDNAKAYNLEALGFRNRDLEVIKDSIKRTVGMILVTGPTGSGKSTTLYTILSQINTPEVNINTVEDPIEYTMPRVNQTQVSTGIGLTFATGLRSFLRQDPDIIMVGEIRDNETADIAINAAMTGHLVLSTLHTNDSSGAIPRLIDMQVESFLVASTLNVVIAQRLVRKLCNTCKKEYKMDPKALKILDEQYNKKGVNKKIENNKYYKAVGCEYCNNGYKGRIGIYEILEIDDKIKELITKKESGEIIQKIAQENGMSLMIEDGLAKATEGITSIEEVLRVVKE